MLDEKRSARSPPCRAPRAALAARQLPPAAARRQPPRRRRRAAVEIGVALTGLGFLFLFLGVLFFFDRALLAMGNVRRCGFIACWRTRSPPLDRRRLLASSPLNLFASSLLTPHSSLLTPHSSLLTPHSRRSSSSRALR
jgi:hypothetical protein